MDTAQRCLPNRMPKPTEFLNDVMEGRALGCTQAGGSSRSILYWLLLGIDGGFICRWRYEHALGIIDYYFRCTRKNWPSFIEVFTGRDRPHYGCLGWLLVVFVPMETIRHMDIPSLRLG